MKITLIVSCLEWLASLLLFIIVEFEKVLYSPDLKMVLIFLVTKVFQKDTMFKWVYVSLKHEVLCHAMVSDKVLWCSNPFFRKNRLRQPS